MPEHDAVNHPRHYAAHPRFTVECIEITRLMSFDAGNALKYLWRHSQKNGAEDLQKANWYVRDLDEHGGGQVWLNRGTQIMGMDLYAAHVAPHLDLSNPVDLAISQLINL